MIGLDEKAASTGYQWELNADECKNHIEIHGGQLINFEKSQQIAEGGCVLGTMTCGDQKNEVCVLDNCASGSVEPKPSVDPVAPEPTVAPSDPEPTVMAENSTTTGEPSTTIVEPTITV